MKEMRKLVSEGYDNGHYDKAYARSSSTPMPFEKFLCDELASRLNKNAKLLDLGCGVGLPFDKYFSKQGITVTGVDISQKHVRKAKSNVPSAHFIQGDFFSSQIKGKFDAIVSFFAIFHIPRNEHKKLFEHIHSKLKKQGLVLLSLGADPMTFDVNNNFAGAPMAWSSYSASYNKKLLEQSGFQILLAVEDYRDERHLWVLAQTL